MEILHIGGRRYSDPDIISLSRQSGGLIDPRWKVVDMARALIEKARQFSALPNDPLLRIKTIASLARIKVMPMPIEQARRETRDAALYPTESGWTVLYNPNCTKPRIVFTIGHEIIHTFFPNSRTGGRFRSTTKPGSRESNELELLCHLGASELVMPLDEFQQQARGSFGLFSVERLASHFGTSFEATVYRLATAHPGLAVSGMLQYRLTKDEDKRFSRDTNQQLLFANDAALRRQSAERKYRRQSMHLSVACREREPDYTIHFNKSFDPSSIVYKAHAGGIHTGIECLPNLTSAIGRIESVRCPYQSDSADKEFGDIFFFWEEIIHRN
jgi:Zn-dependent peptidase ImmA (M78 family)